MSIAKNRAKTLQEKFGFKDDDLKTPAHDAMMLWLDANIEQIVSEIFKRSWTAEEILKKEESARKEIFEIKERLERDKKIQEGEINFYPDSQKHYYLDKLKDIDNKIEKLESWRDIGKLPEKSIKIDKKIWEKPIISHNDFIVGFIDMEVVCRVSKLFFHSSDDLPNLGVNYIEYSLMFEVKTSIKSIGEVIRQIQLYKTYFQIYTNRIYEFIIVSPDDRYIDILKSQGIGFLKCTCDLPKALSQGDLFGV